MRSIKYCDCVVFSLTGWKRLELFSIYMFFISRNYNIFAANWAKKLVWQLHQKSHNFQDIKTTNVWTKGSNTADNENSAIAISICQWQRVPNIQ